MKRTLTGIAAAAVVLGTLSPMAFAATTKTTSSTVKWNPISISAGSYKANPEGFAGYDHGSTTETTFAPVYYVEQALDALGYTATWDGSNLIVKTPSGVTPDFSNITTGTGNASIFVNGTLVKKVYTQVKKDPAGGANAQETTYMPIYYINALLQAAGETAQWNGSGWAMTAPNVAPAVASVKGLNATQAVVTFTQPVSQTDGIVATHYSLNGANPSAVTLSADGKTATLTFTAAQLNVTNGAFVVNGIQTAANPNVLTATYANSFTFDYTTAPSVTSISAVTNGSAAGTVTVNFSEPVTTGYVSIDGVSVGSVTSGANTLTIPGQSLSTGTTHTLSIVNLSDANGNVSQINQSFSVTVDKTAPTIVSAVPYGDNQILVTFSKAMDASNDAGDPTTAGNITVKNETLAPEAITGVTHLTGDTTNTKYVITLNDASLYSTTTTRNLTVLFSGAIQDSVGNTLSAATTRAVTLTQDTKAPTVSSISYLTNPSTGYVTDVLVNFNKPLTGAAGTVVPPTVVDSTGALQSGFLSDGTVAADGTQVDFPVASPAAETGVWTVSVPADDVYDTANTPNGNTAFSGTVNFGSATTTSTWSLTGTPATPVAGTPDKFQVDFGQAVKGGAVTGSATNPASYSINGEALPANTVITLDSATHSIATFTLPAGTISTSNADASFRIAGVQNADGQTLTSFVQPLAVTDNTAPKLVSAKIVDSTHVILAFNEAIADPSGSDAKADFTIAQNGTTLSEASLDASAVTGYSNEIEVTLPSALTAGDTVTVTTTGADSLVTDVAGNYVAGGTTVTAQ